MTKAADIAGQRFGRLVVVSRAGSRRSPSGNSSAQWLCKCDCGNKTVLTTNRLTSGNTRSCGCGMVAATVARSTKHGRRRTRVYGIWSGIISRCENPNATGYEKYGAQGVRVCERWHTFENFYADMGDPPPGMQIERLKNELGYQPGNCEWATPKQQALNRRSTIWITFNGLTRCRSDWARALGVSEQRLTYILKRQPVEVALAPAFSMEESPA